jgi:hypothetical protein
MVDDHGRKFRKCRNSLKKQNKTLPIVLPFSLLSNIFLFIYSFIHMYIHCLGHHSPPPLFPPKPLRFRAEPFLPSSPVLLERRHSNNKKDIVFLLVGDKDSYTEIPIIASMQICIRTQIRYFCLLKIVLQGVFLWHFHVYMH